VLSHPDRSRVVIPNRKIVGEILHNYGNVRQLDVKVGVAYDTDIAHALATVRQVLAGNPRVLADPEPVIRVLALSHSSVEIGIRPWVAAADYVAASGEVAQAVLEAFRAQGVVIPFPQREVRLLGER
jgi:small conductance mechanosensitive channel